MVNPDRNTVLALLDYNPETGIFTHKASRSGVKAGSKAGTPSSVSGYIQIRLPSGRYMAHRLAWLVTHNKMPDAEIDHINGSPADNRIENLRHVSQAENKKNRSKQKNNSSRTTGVRFHHSKSVWEAYIGVSGKKLHLGDFESFEQALAVRRSAEKNYGFHENHGRTAPE